jgi:hypothetical protein
MNFWSHFDPRDFVFCVAKIFGEGVRERDEQAWRLYPRVPLYRSSDGAVVDSSVIRLRVTNFTQITDERARRSNQATHLYFLYTKLPIHVSIHFTDTDNNFHFTFNEKTTKERFFKSTRLSWCIENPTALGDDGIEWTPKALRLIDTAYIPFLASEPHAVPRHHVPAAVYEFLMHFATLLNSLHASADPELASMRKLFPSSRVAEVHIPRVFTEREHRQYVRRQIQASTLEAELNQQYLRKKYQKQLFSLPVLSTHKTADVFDEGDLPEGDLPEGDLPAGDLPAGADAVAAEGDLPEGDLPAVAVADVDDDILECLSDHAREYSRLFGCGQGDALENWLMGTAMCCADLFKSFPVPPHESDELIFKLRKLCMPWIAKGSPLLKMDLSPRLVDLVRLSSSRIVGQRGHPCVRMLSLVVTWMIENFVEMGSNMDALVDYFMHASSWIDIASCREVRDRFDSHSPDWKIIQILLASLEFGFKNALKEDVGFERVKYDGVGGEGDGCESGEVETLCKSDSTRYFRSCLLIKAIDNMARSMWKPALVINIAALHKAITRAFDSTSHGPDSVSEIVKAFREACCGSEMDIFEVLLPCAVQAMVNKIRGEAVYQLLDLVAYYVKECSADRLETIIGKRPESLAEARKRNGVVFGLLGSGLLSRSKLTSLRHQFVTGLLWEAKLDDSITHTALFMKMRAACCRVR